MCGRTLTKKWNVCEVPFLLVSLLGRCGLGDNNARGLPYREGGYWRMETLPGSLTGSLAGIVGAEHVLTGDAAAGDAVDWTGRVRGEAAAGTSRLAGGQGTPLLWRRGSRCAGMPGCPSCPRAVTPAWSAAACRCTARWCSASPGSATLSLLTRRHPRSRRAPGLRCSGARAPNPALNWG